MARRPRLGDPAGTQGFNRLRSAIVFNKRHRLAGLLGATTILGVPALAIADTLTVNDLTTGADTALTSGASGTGNLVLNTDDNASDPLNGCNAGSLSGTKDERVKIRVAASTNRSDGQAVISLNSSDVYFSDCGAPGAQQVQFSALRSGSAVISAAYVSGGKQDRDGVLRPASYTTVDTMTVTVTAPSLALPTVSGAFTSAANPAGWFNIRPTVEWTFGGGAYSSLAGDCLTATGTPLSQQVPAGDTAAGAVTCTATNATGSSAPATVPYKLDTQRPTNAVSSSILSTYTLGAALPAASSACAGTDAGPSGIKSVGTGSKTSALTVNGVGSETISCNNATDNADNVHSTASTKTYSVQYARSAGFETNLASPINVEGNSRVSQKRAVPVKFMLEGDPSNGFNVSGWSVNREKQTCGSETWTDEGALPTTSDSTGLRYDQVSDEYLANVKVGDLAAGTCYRIVVNLDDSTKLVTPKFQMIK